MPQNEIQNGGRRHLEFTSGDYFWHIANIMLANPTIILNFVKISQYTTEL